MKSLKIFRIVTWLSVICLGVLAGILFWSTLSSQQSNQEAVLGGPFTLQTADGRVVTEKIFSGRAHAIFFGFTHCPDVCPTTLAEMSARLDKLGEKAKGLDVYFVTVDPARDTPQFLRDYLSSFSGKITGLTGTLEQIEHVAQIYRIYYRKVPTENGDYTMDHTAAIFLFDRQGDFRGTISYGETEQDALEKLQRIL